MFFADFWKMVYRHILNFWPLVPAVDIQAIYDALAASDKSDEIIDYFDIPFADFQKANTVEHSKSNSSQAKSINVLIVGDGVGCLIKTISRMYRHSSHNLNIYVVSKFPECIVRNLLLMSLLTDLQVKMGILERAETFLEVFGNTLVRASTSSFIASKSTDILEDVVSLKKSMHSIPSDSLSFLKQKEIDDICEVFSFLKSKERDYDVSKAWENALRAYYGTRYDNRENVFDYNYNIRLFDYPIIGLRKYLAWCETGVAFELRKGRYDNPNKTLCMNSVVDKAKSSDFYGDIDTSPYIAFGVECKNEEMLKKASMKYIHTSEDISKFNIADFINEFMTLKTSGMKNSLNVNFLFYSTFCKSQKYKKLFDAVYITCDMTNYANNGSVGSVLKENGIAIFETVNNVVNSTKDRKAKFVEDITLLAEANGLVSAKTVKCCNANFQIFVRDEKDMNP